jgi:hypothetical protein
MENLKEDNSKLWRRAQGTCQDGIGRKPQNILGMYDRQGSTEADRQNNL